MSLQRRLLLYLLVTAPLVWAAALFVSIDRARDEVNELFDSEMIRLARQVQATLPDAPASLAQRRAVPAPVAPAASDAALGDADVQDLAIAVWDRHGELLMSDREGQQLPRRLQTSGFADDVLEGEPWRIYYLQSPRGDWLVAAGQKAYEREELVFSLTSSQVLPWLLVLPLLLAAMAWAVRRALAPVRQLTVELGARDAGDLRPVPPERAPEELKPLLGAMNGLFQRIDDTLARERRFTADAAHELRTPLAALRAQWDVLQHADTEAERRQAASRVDIGLDRMDRLVTQMLALSRVETAAALPRPVPVDWHAIVEQVMNDCLALARRRDIELACDWPPSPADAFPLLGDPDLLTVLLRNLLDNAVRYAPGGTVVSLRFGRDHLTVENAGEPLPAAQLAHLGERFHRPDGQAEIGSGLGVSIARRIASLHGLVLHHGPCTDGRGVRATLGFASSGPSTA